jgi:hypothetical protein
MTDRHHSHRDRRKKMSVSRLSRIYTLTIFPTESIMGMDGETPSWLEEGGSAAALPPPVAPPPPLYPGGDSDAAAAPAAPAKAALGAARDAPPTDNVAGSILASMNAKKKPDATTAAGTIADAEDNEKLSKLIVFMRVLNMAASALLITVSVSLPQCHVFSNDVVR